MDTNNGGQEKIDENLSIRIWLEVSNSNVNQIT